MSCKARKIKVNILFCYIRDFFLANHFVVSAAGRPGIYYSRLTLHSDLNIGNFEWIRVQLSGQSLAQFKSLLAT